MSTSDKFDKIARIAITLALTLSVVLMVLVGNGVIKAESSAKYANLLFDDSRVHTINIECEDWDNFIESCENEEYTLCNITIDGTTVSSVGIRAKGNTSLSSVSQSGSDRYSFKVEFDHYTDAQYYYGLDKMCLNNIIQDNTYMKDYLCYKLMREMGVAAPLCSYAYISVNGEDWGLYIAVETIEESFALRNYGNNLGNLYKPDSISMGGGRGNGKGFDMNDFEDMFSSDTAQLPDMSDFNTKDNTFNPFGGNVNLPDMSDFDPNSSGFNPFGGFGENGVQGDEGTRPSVEGDTSGFSFGFNDISNQFGGGFSNGSSDVKLQYIDDNASSYSNIFDNAKTNISEADKTRLISSLKTLSQYVNGEDADIESVVDIESVIKYFVVHSYVCNDDSYTGTMIHNYYLYEEDGVLSMIPWDYNLAFGGFQGGNATSEVNSNIYNPCSSDMSSLPMLAWIFEDETYTALYEQYYQQFLKIDIEAVIEETYDMIAQYVQKDPTAFCTYEEFVSAKQTLADFCNLRSEAVKRQLNGDDTQVDASSINLSDMGSMGNTMGDGNDARQKEQPQGKTDGKQDFGNQSSDETNTNGQTMPNINPNSENGVGNQQKPINNPDGQNASGGQNIPQGQFIPNGNSDFSENQPSDETEQKTNP